MLGLSLWIRPLGSDVISIFKKALAKHQELIESRLLDSDEIATIELKYVPD